MIDIFKHEYNWQDIKDYIFGDYNVLNNHSKTYKNYQFKYI